MTAYLLAILATIPASIVVPAAPSIVSTSGSLWSGTAVLSDGSALDWRWAPVRSLINLGLAIDWTVAGGGSDLSGRGLIRRHSTQIDEASGTAAGSLLGIALPGLPFGCALPMQIAFDRIVIGGSSQQLAGTVRMAAGSCVPKSGGFATLVPPLTARFGPLGNSSEIDVAPTAAYRQRLVHGTLSREGHLALHVTHEGARVLPFASPPQGLTVDTML